MNFSSINESDIYLYDDEFLDFDFLINETSSKNFKKIKNFSTIKISRYFPKLNKETRNTLQTNLSNILYHLLVGLNIETEQDECDIFLNQLTLNNDRNFLEICNLFFPYIDDKNNFEKQKKIINFKQVVEEKNNEKKNPFQFCNYLFDHSVISNSENILNEERNKALKLNVSKDLDNILNEDEILDKISFLLLNSINSVRYKLYINWLNIFPINLDNYKKTKLYKNSFKLEDGLFSIKKNDDIFFLNHQNISAISKSYKNELKDINIYSENILDKYLKQSKILPFVYSGINVEDIYNTFSCDYYYSVKRNKWLLFEISYDNKFNMINVKCLDEILNLDNIINGKSFNLLKDEDKNKFSKNWSKLLDSVTNGKSLKKFNSENLNQILTYFVSYFEFHYNNIKTLERESKYFYLPGSKKNTDYDPEEEDIIFDNKNISIGKKQQFTINDVLKSISDVPIEDIYNFIFSEINEIKNTIYKDILIDDNNILKDLKFSKNENESYELTPKNYYNFGKSLNLNNNVRMSKLWDGLSMRERDLTCFRLNSNENIQSWFKIGGILKKFNITNIKIVNDTIYKKIRENVIDLTFENLIKKGCISIFEVNPSVTDTKIITNDYSTKKKNLEKNLANKIFTKERTKQYENAYYFATNQKYKNMDKIVIKNNKIKNIGKLEHDSDQIKLSYLEYLKSPTITGDMWYSFYAMDWACQINFFIKLINKRITYVTGATGQGKSTQVPKLYLFGLKSLLYKNNSKIFCTAPRIGPVLENSKSISKSLGLPIEHYDKTYKKKVKTLNSIVQYQYANDKHVDVNSEYFLRIMTDGTLLQILYGNQMLKQKISFNNENKFNPKSVYNDRNLCDLVIIDEAHEHNKNMDIILTMIKYTLFYNNDIRLSIISATMDDDEPIFRKFYRFVDDNLLYPISTFNLSSRLDRNILDRRYHISPPGESTQYKIDEYYEDNSSDDYDTNEELAIKKISEIFKSSTDGDILTFSTTQKKIYEMASKLNKIIPSDCITLPYYSKLKEEYQVFSKEADSKVKEIDIDRDDLLELFNNNKSEEECKKVNKGTYKRCCIIATNAAEASLTITSLKFVVDLGFQLRIKYNYDEMQDEILDNEKITEASRLQRKGRVGRVKDGSVYYMYPKNSRIDVKSEFNISSDNFSETFKDLLAVNDTEKSEVISSKVIEKLLLLKDLDNDDKKLLNRNSKIIYDQYKINDSFYDSDKNCIFIDYEKNNKDQILSDIYGYYFPSYTTGFSHNHLIDTSGHFYLIHPLESDIERDLMSSNIINKDGKFEGIESKVISKIYEAAAIKQDIFIFDKIIKKNSKVLEYNDINLKLKSYNPDYLKLFSNSLILDENLETSRICIFVIKLLELISYDITNLVDEKDTFNKFIEINQIYSQSDIEYFIKLYHDLSEMIKFEDVKKKEDTYYKNLSNDMIKFIDKKFKITTDLISSFCKKFLLPENTYLDILKLVMKGDLSLDGVKKEELVSKEGSFNELVSKSNLSKYCKQNYLNYEIISSALSNYFKEEGKLNQDYTENVKNLKDMTIFPKYKDITEKVIYCFSMTYFHNTFYIKNNKSFKYIRNNSLNLGSTLLKNVSSLGFYLNNNKKANILTNLNKDTLIDIAPFLIIFQTDNNKDYFNFEDLKQNISELTKKLTDYSGESIFINTDNLDIEDKNFLNILMKQIIEKPNSLTGGGNSQYIGKISKQLLKTRAFKEYLKDINIENYSYGYVNLVNSKINGLNLIKQKDNNCLVKIVVDNDYLNKYTKTRLLNRNQGYILK